MPSMRSSGVFALAVLCFTAVTAGALAQSGDPLAVGRRMLAEDNPGDLWVERVPARGYVSERRVRHATPVGEARGLRPESDLPADR